MPCLRITASTVLKQGTVVHSTAKINFVSTTKLHYKRIHVKINNIIDRFLEVSLKQYSGLYTQTRLYSAKLDCLCMPVAEKPTIILTHLR